MAARALGCFFRGIAAAVFGQAVRLSLKLCLCKRSRILLQPCLSRCISACQVLKEPHFNKLLSRDLSRSLDRLQCWFRSTMLPHEPL
jgi:hypothetical protein